MPNEQFFNYIMARQFIFRLVDDEVHFLLDQHA